MEIVFEILFEMFLELMMFIVPEENRGSKKHRAAAFTVSIAVLVAVLALVIWGCILISDYNNKLGAIPITVAVVISILWIVLGLVMNAKRQ